MLDPAFISTIGTMVSSAASGVAVNLASSAVWWVGKRGWQALGECGEQDLVFEADLQRSVRKSQLEATKELLSASLDYARSDSKALPEDEQTLQRLLEAAKTELETLPETSPDTPIDDAHLNLLDESTAPLDQLQRMRARQEESLRADLERWAGSDTVPAAIDDLLKDGWTIRRSSGETLARDWHSLIAIAFMQELKNNQQAKALFDSKILAELKTQASDNRLDQVSNFESFEQAFGKVLPTLERLEGTVVRVAESVQRIDVGVQKIIDELLNRPGVSREAIRAIEQALNQFAAEFAPTQATISNLNKLLAVRDQDLAKANEELRQWISKYKSLEQQLKELADDEGDVEFQSARDLLDQGDLKGAGNALRRLIDRLEQKEQALTQKRATALSNLAQVHELQFEWDQAIATRERAVAICPDDADLRLSLALLLAKQNQFDAAIDHYRQLIQQTSEDPTRAGYLNNLGLLYSDTNRLEKAEQAYDEGLELYRDLAGGNPDAYRPYVATTLNNLAILYNDTNRLEKAEQAYDEALVLRRDLARVNPDAYRPGVATTLNNLANLYGATNRLDLAEKALIEAIELLEPFYRANPGGRGDSWAKSHVLLAMVQRNSGDCAAAVATVARTREIVGWEAYAVPLQQVEDGCGQ